MPLRGVWRLRRVLGPWSLVCRCAASVAAARLSLVDHEQALPLLIMSRTCAVIDERLVGAPLRPQARPRTKDYGRRAAADQGLRTPHSGRPRTTDAAQRQTTDHGRAAGARPRTKDAPQAQTKHHGRAAGADQGPRTPRSGRPRARRSRRPVPLLGMNSVGRAVRPYPFSKVGTEKNLSFFVSLVAFIHEHNQRCLQTFDGRKHPSSDSSGVAWKRQTSCCGLA